MASTFTLDSRADRGFSNAALYDAHRPSYPPEAVNKILAHLNVADVPKAQIIDLACGTGKFTELLAKRPERYEIIGVEPHKGMREELVKKNLEGVKVQDGDAANMGVDEGWGDACVAAQAFHWFANEESLKGIHRVLRPGAAFGMIWNIEDYNSPKAWPVATKFEQLMKDILASLEDGHPRFRHMKWKDVFEKQQDTTPLQTMVNTFKHDFSNFSLPLGEEDVEWTVYLDDEAVWARYSTLSQIANCADEKREEIRKQVLDELKEEGVERNEKGEVAVHGKTHLAWTSRI